MKIKIRGLVFVGFAAAVFAQSALAVFNDDKTVTSKTYVDNTFQFINERQASTVDDDDNPVTTIDSESDDDHYPTSKNVYLALQDAAAAAHGEFQRQLDSGENKDPYIGIIADGESDWKPLRSAESGYVTVSQISEGGHLTKVEVGIPASEVASTATAIAGSNGAGPASTDSSDLTTAKAVYDFVTAEVAELGSTGITGNTSYHTQKVLVVTQAWATAQGYTSTMITGTPTSGDLAHVDHWELIVPDSVVAESGSDIGGTTQNPGPASGHGTDLTTAQAVYDFVTGNGGGDGFQRKVTTGEADTLETYWTSWANEQRNAGVGVKVGYRSPTSGGGYGDSTWVTLIAAGDGAGADGNLSYLQVIPAGGSSRDTYEVDIKGDAIATAGSGITAAGATGAYSKTKDKLTTAKAVYDYAVPMDWGSTNGANKKLVTDSTGHVILAEDTGSVIPSENEMPSACKNSAANDGGKVCALVAYYDGTLNSGNGGVRYEWTIMAPTE